MRTSLSLSEMVPELVPPLLPREVNTLSPIKIDLAGPKSFPTKSVDASAPVGLIPFDVGKLTLVVTPSTATLKLAPW